MKVQIETSGSLRQELHKEDGEYYVRSSQDVEPYLKRVKQLRHLSEGGNRGGAASIPPLLYYVVWPEEFKNKYGYDPRQISMVIKQYQDQYGVANVDAAGMRAECAHDWAEFQRQKLNDRDYQHLRIDPSKKL